MVTVRDILLEIVAEPSRLCLKFKRRDAAVTLKIQAAGCRFYVQNQSYRMPLLSSKSKRQDAASTMPISVIIITHNEEANIGDCLDGLGFAHEVLVLDYASTDRTAEIARSWGASVHVTHDWPGFGPQKNRVLALATGDWVLSIDADERVTPALREEILKAVDSGSLAKAFCFPRRSSYCGQFIDHCGWSPDWVLRLFRRGHAKFTEDRVHEKLVASGSVEKIYTPLLHLSFPDFESVLDKANRYSTAGAQTMASQGKSANLGHAIFHGAWAFFRTYILKRGFLDGQLGLALALSNAEGSYYRYAKLWLITRTKPSR